MIMIARITVLTIILLFSINVFTQVDTPIQVDDRIEEGIALMFQTQHAQSLELLIEAQNTAKKNQWYEQFFRATLNIGSNYYMLSDYGEALQYYLQAYEIAIEHLGSRQEMAVLNNVGVLYIQEQELSQAKKYFLKAYKKAKQIEDDDKVGYYAVNLALVYNKMRKVDSAQFYIHEAMPLLRDIPNVLLVGKMAQAEVFLLKKQYAKSEEMALSLLLDLQDKSQIENKVFILLVLAQINEGRNKIDKALYYANQAKNAKKGFENRTEIYDYLSELYVKTGDFEKAIAYKDSVIVATDSLNTTRNRKLFENEKVKFQLQNYQHELSESREVLKQERRFFYSILSIALLCIVLILWVFRSNSIKHKQRKKL
jgi:tetratricopeptide (TPR) repeat protein